jgi:hypothetical protein
MGVAVDLEPLIVDDDDSTALLRIVELRLEGEWGSPPWFKAECPPQIWCDRPARLLSLRVLEVQGLQGELEHILPEARLAQPEARVLDEAERAAGPGKPEPHIGPARTCLAAGYPGGGLGFGFWISEDPDIRTGVRSSFKRPECVCQKGCF